MSYRCTKNLESEINMHNAKIMKTQENGYGDCNCRNPNMCPVGGKCLTEGVIYQAIVTREDGIVDTYIGMTANSFKGRWRNHVSSFKTRNPNNSTALSRYIWDIQDKKIGYSLQWRLVSRGKPYNHVTDTCRLCIREKIYSIPP